MLLTANLRRIFVNMNPSAKGKNAPILQRRYSSSKHNQSTQCLRACVIGKIVLSYTFVQRFTLLNCNYSKKVVNTSRVTTALMFTVKFTKTPLEMK